MFQLEEKQKQKIAEMCQNFGVTLLLLFGSQVSGKIHEESDIDLAFASNHHLSFEEETRLNAELQAIFGEQPIQTVNIFKTNPLLKKRIFDEHLPLYVESSFLYYTLASYAIKSYLETKQLRDNVGEYLKQKYVKNR